MLALCFVCLRLNLACLVHSNTDPKDNQWGSSSINIGTAIWNIDNSERRHKRIYQKISIH
jgi:hypothetical protein